MVLSRATKYAIQAILFLASKSAVNNKIGAKKIAENITVPLPFLSKLLQRLVKHKLVLSTKGPNGGFYMDNKGLSKSLWDVVICIDGFDLLDECVIGQPNCGGSNPCAVHHIVASFREGLKKEFKDKSIAQIVESGDSGIMANI